MDLRPRLAAALLAASLAACTAPVATPSPRTATPAPSTAPPPPTQLFTPAPSPSPSPSPSPTLSPAPTGLTSPRGTITVDQPRAFATVASPLTVSGTASVFEAQFSWRVVDLAGKQLASGTAQASQGAPARGTYSFTATVSVAGDTRAYVEVFSLSARDGSVDDMARVPVVIAKQP